MTLPAGGADPNAPTQDYFPTAIFFSRSKPGAKAAANALGKLLAPADVRPMPARGLLRALDPGSMLLVALGQTFHNDLTSQPAEIVPKRQETFVRDDSESAAEL